MKKFNLSDIKVVQLKRKALADTVFTSLPTPNDESEAGEEFKAFSFYRDTIRYYNEYIEPAVYHGCDNEGNQFAMLFESFMKAHISIEQMISIIECMEAELLIADKSNTISINANHIGPWLIDISDYRKIDRVLTKIFKLRDLVYDVKIPEWLRQDIIRAILEGKLDNDTMISINGSEYFEVDKDSEQYEPSSVEIALKDYEYGSFKDIYNEFAIDMMNRIRIIREVYKFASTVENTGDDLGNPYIVAAIIECEIYNSHNDLIKFISNFDKINIEELYALENVDLSPIFLKVNDTDSDIFTSDEAYVRSLYAAFSKAGVSLFDELIYLFKKYDADGPVKFAKEVQRLKITEIIDGELKNLDKYRFK